MENSSSESLIRSNLICLGLKGWRRTSNRSYCNLSFLLWSSSSVTFLCLFCSPSRLPTSKQGRGFGRPLNCQPDAPHKTWPNVWKHLKMLLKREEKQSLKKAAWKSEQHSLLTWTRRRLLLKGLVKNKAVVSILSHIPLIETEMPLYCFLLIIILVRYTYTLGEEVLIFTSSQNSPVTRHSQYISVPLEAGAPAEVSHTCHRPMSWQGSGGEGRTRARDWEGGEISCKEKGKEK